MRDLFHGTIYDISKIDVTRGRGYKDFGNGYDLFWKTGILMSVSMIMIL